MRAHTVDGLGLGPGLEERLLGQALGERVVGGLLALGRDSRRLADCGAVGAVRSGEGLVVNSSALLRELVPLATSDVLWPCVGRVGRDVGFVCARRRESRDTSSTSIERDWHHSMLSHSQLGEQGVVSPPRLTTISEYLHHTYGDMCTVCSRKG